MKNKTTFLDSFIVLLLIPFVCLFFYGRKIFVVPDLILGIYALYYNILAVLIASKLFQNRKTKYIFKFRLISFAFLILFLGNYLALLTLYKETLYMFHPFVFLVILIMFLFTVYKTKMFLLYLIIFLSIPSYIVMDDIIETNNFLNTCVKTTPKATYNPIYLSETFFHKTNETDSLSPNILERGKHSKSYNDLTEQSNNIIVSGICPIGASDQSAKDFSNSIKKLMDNNNVVLCKNTVNYHNCLGVENDKSGVFKSLKPKECIVPSENVNYFIETIYFLDTSLNRTEIASKTSQYFTGTSIARKLIRRRKRNLCRYNIASVDTSIDRAEFRNEENDFNNFIKVK